MPALHVLKQCDHEILGGLAQRTTTRPSKLFERSKFAMVFGKGDLQTIFGTSWTGPISDVQDAIFAA